jgi:hypothetical protein
MPEKIALKWNPGRVCYGLSRIGYTPTSAICDIVDNAITANATNIWIYMKKENEFYADSKKNNVKEYVIIDNGIGMNKEKILKALELGSDDAGYAEDTLSKFGLGLKSASFSQGDVLEVISTDGESSFSKCAVDLSQIKDEYFCEELELNEQDNNLIDKHLPDGKGTIIRISKIRKNNHPSIKSTIDELKYKIGVIYYYFMKDDGIKVLIEDEMIQPYDVLFTNEANSNGNLNEHECDGLSVKWIQKPLSVVLDGENNINATIEATQLPHPPSMELEYKKPKNVFRDFYRITASNYGYYVYRNKRLISWAEHFNGIIPFDQDYYSFRGRILIDSSADDCFNIDVKKASLVLSDEASNSIDDFTYEYKKKSKTAWAKAGERLKQLQGKEPNNVANDIAEQLEFPEILPGQNELDDATAKEIRTREEVIQKEDKEKMLKKAIELKKEAGGNVDDTSITEQEVEVLIKGEADESGRKKIFRVDNTQDFTLWEPYYDAELGVCARINKNHRFSKLIYEDNHMNTDMQVLYDLVLLTVSQAEIYALKNSVQYSREELANILCEYRRIISEYLATLCRSPLVKLPPFGE